MTAVRSGRLGTVRSRAGFTIVELIIVVVMIGLLAMMVGPWLSRSYGSVSRRSADREVAAMFFRARSAAIQRSRAARLVRTGNALQIWVDSAGTLVALSGSRDMGQQYGVTLSAAPSDTLQFDPRGFAILAGGTPKVMITKSPAVDTVCVAGLGRVATRGCQ